jgi:hypothetical protein
MRKTAGIMGALCVAGAVGATVGILWWRRRPGAREARAAITILAPAEQLYELWMGSVARTRVIPEDWHTDYHDCQSPDVIRWRWDGRDAVLIFTPDGVEQGVSRTIVRLSIHGESLPLGLEANLRKALWKFRQLAETGELATIEGQSSGRARGKTARLKTMRSSDTREDEPMEGEVAV